MLHATVIIDENVPDEVADFLAARGATVWLARERFGAGTLDPVIAAAAARENALIITIDRKDFIGLAKRHRKDGQLSYAGMSVVTFHLSHPRVLARLRLLIEDIEDVYENRVTGRGVRLIATISDTVLRIEDP